MTDPTAAERIVAKDYNPANFQPLIQEIATALAKARREATIEEQAKWHQAGYEDGQRKVWEQVSTLAASRHLSQAREGIDNQALWELVEEFRRRSRAQKSR